MSESKLVDRLQEPLSPATRSARRSLIASSSVGIAVVQAGLLPTEIPSLGIDLSSADQGTLLLLNVLVVLYFSVSFVFYGAADLIAIQIIRSKRNLSDFSDSIDEAMGNGRGPEDEYTEFHDRIAWWISSSRSALFLRSIFEFAFPAIVACYALLVLAKAYVAS